MFCPSCGKENEGDSKFCASCGYNLESEATIKPNESIQKVKLMSTKNLFIFSLLMPLIGSILIIFQVKKLKKDILPYIILSVSMFLFEFGLIPLVGMYTNDYFIGDIVRLIPRLIIGLVLAVILWSIYKKIYISYNNGQQTEKVYSMPWGIPICAILISISTIMQFSSLGGSLTTALYGQSSIDFGRKSVTRDIEDKTNVFHLSDNTIYYGFYFQGGKGGGIIDTVLEDVNSGKVIYDSGQTKIPPDWQGVCNSIRNPGYKGNFEMKIVKNNEVIAKGKFDVK